MSFGFGSGFGASSSAFGSGTAFGGSATTMSFGGSAPSPFGATGSTFGQTQPAFGAAAQSQPAFGASAFGASAPAAGAPFGQSQPAFGATPAASPFGQTQSAFGAPKPFGATGFGASQPATSAFGAPAPAAGAFGGFGAAAAPTGRGSRAVAYRRTQEVDTSSAGQKSTVYYNSITCMPEYSGKSTEEIRWEDYQDGVKGGGATAAAAPAATGGLFGQQPAAGQGAPSPFGQPAAASTPWGAPAQTTQQPSAFGAVSPGPFGQPAASSSAFGGFGAASSSASPFGAASTGGFGFGGASSAAAAGGPFGTSTPAFGAASAAPSPFGAPASTPSAFGGFPSSAPSTFGFGAASQPFGAAASGPAFGAASQPAASSPFGAPAAGGFAFGGAAASSAAPLFGTASTPAGGGASLFGGTAAKPATGGFGFGGSQPPPAFGAPSTGTSLFGAASTPAAGSTPSFSFGGAASTPAFGATTGGGLFGGGASTPGLSTGGFSFAGAGSTPAFGAPSSGGLFGATSAPAFGGTTTPGGGLFGAAQSTPAFSFTPPTGGTGALGFPSAMGLGGGAAAAPAAAQAPGVGTSPYGTLPEAPKVTPLPEYKVGLTQRVLGPPSGGPPRPVAFITPRSLTPHAGARLRPRQRASASRLSRSPAEFFAAAARGGATTPGGGGAIPTPSTAGSIGSTPTGNGSATNIFVPRDNVRKLFIRDALPSTEGATLVSPSPSSGAGAGGPAGRTPGTQLRLTPASGRRMTSGGGLGSAEKTNGVGGGAVAVTGARTSPAGGFGAAHISDAELAALLPRLGQPDYYTEPSLTQLAAMGRDEPSSLGEVANFVVGRRGVGCVRWLEPVDVRGIDVDAIVSLSRGSVEVYLEDEGKPEVGQGLNRPAEVTMWKVFKVDKATGKPTKDPEAVERFARKLKKVTAEQGARFVSYDGETGTWKFEVEHFSRYGLVDSDEEEAQEDEAGGDGMETQGGGHRREQDGGASTAGPSSARYKMKGGSSKDKGQEEDFRLGGGRTAVTDKSGAAEDHDAEDGDEMFDDSEEDDNAVPLGLRSHGRASASVGNKKRGQVAAAAGMEIKDIQEDEQKLQQGQDKKDDMGIVVGGDMGEGDGMEGDTLASGANKKKRGASGPSPRGLLESLPERAHMQPEDLLHIRAGLYGESPYSQEAAEKQQRRIEVDLTTLPSSKPAAGAASPGAQQPSLAASTETKNIWRRNVTPALRPPLPARTHAAAEPESPTRFSFHRRQAQPSMPLLPSRPMAVSPPGAALSSPCPVKPLHPDGKERCLPDSGLFLGASFRAGWAPGGLYCVAEASGGSASAATLSMRQLVLGGGGGGGSLDVSANKNAMQFGNLSARAHQQQEQKHHHRSTLQRRLQAQLRLHYDNSLPEPHAGSVAPRWRMHCTRFGGSLRDVTRRYLALCNDHAAEMSTALSTSSSSEPSNSVSAAIQRGVLKHQAAAWDLVHVLFSAVSAENEKKDDENDHLTAMGSDDDASMCIDDAVAHHRQHPMKKKTGADINNGAEEEQEDRVDARRKGGDLDANAMHPPSTRRLEDMQRRACLSRWLQERCRSAAEAAARASSDAASRATALLCGHQLAAAIGAAAAAGNVRLATLLSVAGASSSARERLAAQLAVWKDAGFEPHIQGGMKTLYALLAGDANDVVPMLELDWRRALGVHLWYGRSPSSSVVEALDAYSEAAKRGVAPPPVPVYVERTKGTLPATEASSLHDKGSKSALPRYGGHDHAGEDDEDMLDGDDSEHGSQSKNSDGLYSWRNLDGYAALDVNFELLRLFKSLSDSGGVVAAAQRERLVGRLLRPATTTPDPLDYSFSWHLLSVLRAIGVIVQHDFAAAARTHMGFISQLESLGGMSHWAVYVALHLPDARQRDATVRHLLARYCPEWAGDVDVETFLVESLRVPVGWLAEARALWARQRKDNVALAAELADAGDWAGAHETLCSTTAPSWLLAGGSALSDLADAIAEMEPHAAQIDVVQGGGSWARGGGLYAAYLELRHVYASLGSKRREQQPLFRIPPALQGCQSMAVDAEAEANAEDQGEDGEEETTMTPTYEQRMEACAALADRLNDAAAHLAATPTSRYLKRRAGVDGPGARPSPTTGRNSNRSRNVDLGGGGVDDQACGGGRGVALRRAALARMSEELSKWVLSDARGESAIPGTDHAALTAGLRPLRAAPAAVAVQIGAVAVATSIG